MSICCRFVACSSTEEGDNNVRFVTYRHETNSADRLGLLCDGGLVDVTDALEKQGMPAVMSMGDLVQHGLTPVIRECLEQYRGTLISTDRVTLCAPFPRPAMNVICLGRNYGEHVREQAVACGEAVGEPTFFTKAVTSVTGPHASIPSHSSITKQLDWEVELAVVIGRTASAVSREQALDCVFGYMALNDVSARDLQYSHGGQFFFGKSLDGLCPTGPWLVTAEDVFDPQNLTLEARVNGEVVQHASTADMLLSVADIIERLSRGLTLLPGQIIATGTPAGVGYARTPPRFLTSGDVLESTITGLGLMRNVIRA